MFDWGNWICDLSEPPTGKKFLRV